MSRLVLYEYDKTNPMAIYLYARRLEGHSFLDILHSDGIQGIENLEVYSNKARKGGLGNLVEEHYFHYKINNKSAPDFEEAGMELKVAPFERKKKDSTISAGEIKAGERVVLTMINYDEPMVRDLYQSHLWYKCKDILFIYYHRDKNNPTLQDCSYKNLFYYIWFVKRFTPPDEDLIIIRQDYEYIADKVRAGRAHELSEADTLYLGACTKGATAEKSIVPQTYYNPTVSAKTRAYCYKTSYMTIVLNKYIAVRRNDGAEDEERIISDIHALQGQTFQTYIESIIARYKGLTDEEICRIVGMEYQATKRLWIDLAFRMLGIKSNRAEEFSKANIVVKAIRIEENGNIQQSMSFPAFQYKELAAEEWEESTFYNYFSETKLLFIVYKKDGERYRLKGCQFWNMPYRDLNETAMNEWQAIVDVIREGVQLTPVVNSKGEVSVKNNFPGSNKNGVLHIRPHSPHTYYELEDGRIITDAKGSRGDASELPDGRWMTKYGFWLNKPYVLSQIRSDLKE